MHPLIPLSAGWSLDPAVAYLNHGAFGACPAPVLEAQSEWRARLERNPTQFFDREYESLIDGARDSLAPLLHADAGDLALIHNATEGVNTVLRWTPFAAGDEILVTDQGYPACQNAARARAFETGAKVVVAAIPFPIASADDVLSAILAKVTPRTKLALIDHVTSPTGLVFPIAAIVAALRGRGVETLIDGAHAPGMVPIDLGALGADYYTGNCHKWLCTPKGAAFLWVRPGRQAHLRPLVISHGASSTRRDRSRFRLEFDWTGTGDPTAWLCLPEAQRFLGTLLPGGLPSLMDRNRALALAARELLCAALRVALPAPAEMIGSLAAVPLPAGTPREAEGVDPLQQQLRERHRIEVPVFAWPAPPRRLLRLSAQAYNGLEEYRRLARALVAELGAALGPATPEEKQP